MKKKLGLMLGTALLAMASQAAMADCKAAKREVFEAAVQKAVADTNQFGFGAPMWVTMVDETGMVCHVYSYNAGDGAVFDNPAAGASTGARAGNTAWLGSRIISAQKANTANAFSLDAFAISTGFIYAAIVPGGSLYGLQHSNPVDTSRAYGGSPNNNGTKSDFLRNKRIGGINVFGGGVALYDSSGVKVGAIGASGDTSCRDHSVAWHVRANLGLDHAPNSDALKLVASPAALGEHPACGVNDPTGANNGIAP